MGRVVSEGPIDVAPELDLIGRRLISHCDSSGSVYKSLIAYKEDERIAPLAARERLVADLLAF